MSDSQPPRGTFPWRRLGTAALVLAALLLVGYIAAAVVLRSLVSPERLSRWVQPRLEAALDRDVRLGGARVELFPHLGLELDSLTVENLKGFRGAPLARIGEVSLRVRLLPLVLRRVVVDHVILHGPQLSLQVDEKGTSNYGDLVPEKRPGEALSGGGPVRLDVRRVEIDGGMLLFRDRARGTLLQAGGVVLGADVGDLEGGDRPFDLAGRASRVDFFFPPAQSRPVRRLDVSLALQGRAGRDYRWVQISDGQLSVNDVGARLTGRVDSLRAPVRRVDLRLLARSVPLERIFAALPDSLQQRLDLRPTGSLDADLSVSGEAGPALTPSVSGLVTLREGGATKGTGLELASGVEGEARIRGDSLDLVRLRGQLLGAEGTVSGRLSLDSTRAFDLHFQGDPRLDRVAALHPREGLGAAGDLLTDLRASGRLGEPGRIRLDGQLQARQLRATLPSLAVPLSIPDGTVRLSGQRATWSDLALSLGGDRLSISGTVTSLLARLGSGDGTAVPEMSATLSGPWLHLDEIFPPSGPDSLGYVRLAVARLGGTRVGGRPPEAAAAARGLSRPASLPVRGRIRIAVDSLTYAPYALGGVRGDLELAPDLLSLSDARFRFYGGRGSGQMRMALGGAADQPFSLVLHVDSVRAGDFFSEATPFGRFVTGTLTLELQSAGSLDSLLLPVAHSVRGDGSMGVTDGKLSGLVLTSALSRFFGYAPLSTLDFRRWFTRFSIEDGSVRFAGGSLSAPAADFELAGAVGFGGALDLGLQMRVPASRLGDLSLRKAGLASDLVQRLSTSGRPLQLGLAVGGTLRQPTVALDASAVQERATEAVRSQAEQRAREQLRQPKQQLEEKARQLLRQVPGFVPTAPDSARKGAADSTSASPPDSA